MELEANGCSCLLNKTKISKNTFLLNLIAGGITWITTKYQIVFMKSCGVINHVLYFIKVWYI